MKEGRILKGLDKTQWFRPKRGGKDKREAKEVPDIIKEETSRWAGKRRKKSKEEGTEEPETRQEGNDRQPQEGECRRQGTVVVETVIFVPYTPQSILKKKLQEADDCLTSSLGRPRARFVENAGGTIVTQVGRPNPWKAEIWCARDECVACQGRLVIEKEKEDKAVGAVTGEMEGKEAIMKMPKKEQIALPGCTREGIVYILECLSCRHQGIKRQWISKRKRT